MSDEPLYCTVCGAEWGDCDHPLPGDDDWRSGPYCEVCGVVPADGHDCATTGRPCWAKGD